MQDLQSLETEITAKLAVATSVGDVENIRIAELGKKGRVSLLMRELGKMTPEEKNEFGPKQEDWSCLLKITLCLPQQL